MVVVGCGPSVDIHQAAEDGNIEAVKQHIAAGKDLNTIGEDGWAPLHSAAIEGHKEVAKLLIESGANVNANDDLVGMTPLHHAAECPVHRHLHAQ